MSQARTHPNAAAFGSVSDADPVRDFILCHCLFLMRGSFCSPVRRMNGTRENDQERINVFRVEMITPPIYFINAETDQKH